MPRRTLSWKALTPGIVLLVAVTGVAIVVLLFARLGSLRGDTYRLYMRAIEARGVLEGTPVWLAGKKIGRVASVRFGPVTDDTAGALLIELELLEEHREMIRRDSRASIRSSGTLVGAPVVALTVGTPATPVLASDDTLPNASQLDTEELTSQLALASRQLPVILKDVSVLSVQLDTTRRRIGGIRAERGAGPEALVRRLEALEARVRSDSGVLGHIGAGDELMRHLRRAAALADTLLTEVGSGSGTIGRFASDSALLDRLGGIRDDLSAVSAMLRDARGSAGRFAADSVLRRQLARLQWEIEETMRDIKRNPERYFVLP
jgi:phospholipid/cholesterol/gamma-HCH transport system substrate-binding protein